MTKFKKPILFTLSLLPIAIVGGLFTQFFFLDTQSEEVINQAVAQVGSVNMLKLITVVQTVLYATVCGFFGYIISDKIGLIKKTIAFNKKGLLIAVIFGVLLGIILGVDHFTSGALYPKIQSANIDSFSLNGILASVFYGGIIEEVMLRLFFMALLALIIWKVFFKKYSREEIPHKVLVIANVVAALVFSLGHIPATIGIFGTLTPFIVIRCFVLNGVAGYLFGEAFRKYGIGYAMIAHALAHIVKFIIFAIFI